MLVYKEGLHVIEICSGSYLLLIPEIDVAWIFNPYPDISKFLIQKQLPFNGVVCPDTRVQNGVNCNLFEFPLLHTLFLQGRIFRGEKAYIIGTKNQLTKSAESFKRSLYGFYNASELKDLDLSNVECKQLMKEIKGLSFNGIKPVNQVLHEIELEPLGKNSKRNHGIDFKGLNITKTGINKFEITWKSEQVTIDANVKESEKYQPPLKIDVKNIPLTLYQVIDTGEEDGFAAKSCMHTVVQWRDKIICIDLPMNVTYLLNKISISRFEIDAVLFTHCHDDHIGDISMLMQLDKQIKVICPKVIWKSILLKVSSMMSVSIEELENYFDYVPIKYGEEYNFSGLRIMAHPSIHSVPCAIYKMRGMVNGKWKTYSHLSDILNFKRCKKLVKDKIITSKRFEEYKKFLLEPTNIKKIDVGCVPGTEEFSVHGSWIDFKKDKSDHIVLGHISEELLSREAKIHVGQMAVAGSSRDMSMRYTYSYINKYEERAIQYLGDYIFNLLADELNQKRIDRERILDSLKLLANQEIVLIQPNTPFLKSGDIAEHVDMIVSGIGTIWKQIGDDIIQVATVQAGDVIGEMGVLRGTPRNASIVADTYLRVLRIPGQLFKEEMYDLNIFRPEHKGESILDQVWNKRHYVQKTGLLNQQIPVYIHNKIAQHSEVKTFKKGELIFSCEDDNSIIIMTKPDSYVMKISGKKYKMTDNVPVFGECSFLKKSGEPYEIYARTNTKILILDSEKYEWMKKIPVLLLRFNELYENRLLNMRMRNID